MTNNKKKEKTVFWFSTKKYDFFKDKSMLYMMLEETHE